MTQLTLGKIAKLLGEFEEWIITYDDDTSHLIQVGRDAALLMQAVNTLEEMSLDRTREFDFAQFLNERKEQND